MDGRKREYGRQTDRRGDLWLTPRTLTLNFDVDVSVSVDVDVDVDMNVIMNMELWARSDTLPTRHSYYLSELA